MGEVGSETVTILKLEFVMHANTRKLFKKYAKEYFQPNTRVLEVGPGVCPTKIQLIVGDTSVLWETAGIDRTCPVTYVGTEYSFPIESDVADIVIATNVMEHVRKPWVWIKELARICKPGGYVHYDKSRKLAVSPVSHRLLAGVSGRNDGGFYEDAGLSVVTSRAANRWKMLTFTDTFPGGR